MELFCSVNGWFQRLHKEADLFAHIKYLFKVHVAQILTEAARGTRAGGKEYVQIEEFYM